MGSGRSRSSNTSHHSSDNLSTDLSSSCSINIDPSHAWSLAKSNHHHRHSNHHSLSTVIQDFGKFTVNLSRASLLALRPQMIVTDRKPSCNSRNMNLNCFTTSFWICWRNATNCIQFMRRKIKCVLRIDESLCVYSLTHLELERDADWWPETCLSQFHCPAFHSVVGGKTTCSNEIIRSTCRSCHADEQ